jgi:hypothetical protein
MLDTNIYDLLVADAPTLQLVEDRVAAGRISIITTHVQVDQLIDIPDATKRQAVLSVPTVKVRTTGAMWDVSKWGEARFGDDSTNANLDQLMKGNPKHAPDALIGVTASSVADMLVTNDSS